MIIDAALLFFKNATLNTMTPGTPLVSNVIDFGASIDLGPTGGLKIFGMFQGMPGEGGATAPFNLTGLKATTASDIAKGATSGSFTIASGILPAGFVASSLKIANVVIAGVTGITGMATTDGVTVTFTCDATAADVAAKTAVTFDASGEVASGAVGSDATITVTVGYSNDNATWFEPESFKLPMDFINQDDLGLRFRNMYSHKARFMRLSVASDKALGSGVLTAGINLDVPAHDVYPRNYVA